MADNGYLFQDAPQTGDALPTGQLANISRDQESKFAQTAPNQGYLNQPQMPNQLPAVVQQMLKTSPSTVLNEGFAKGFTLGQANQRQNLDTNMSEQKLSMAEEQQGWARSDREQNRAISDGMADAAQGGGFSGVINYLQTVDPTRAMQFMDAKNTLDQSMMKTDVMKALLPAQKADALVQGYGVLGKMGQAILGAPPAERAGMYQTILPILKTVNPDAPTSLNADAAHMMLLSASQADPSNMLFANGLASTQARNASDVLQARIQTRINNGETMNTSAGLSEDVNTLKENEMKYATSQAAFNNSKLTQNNLAITAAKTQQEMASAIQKQNTDLQTAYNKDPNTVTYMKYKEENDKFQGAVSALQQNPNNPAAQTAAFLTLQGLYTRGKMTPDSKSMFANSDSGVDEVMKKLNNEYTTNNKVVVTPEEIQRLTSLQQNVGAQMNQQQAITDNRFSKMADQFDPAGKFGLKANLPMYSTQNNSPAYINQKADALVQQAQGNPQLIQQIETARQQMLTAGQATTPGN